MAETQEVTLTIDDGESANEYKIVFGTCTVYRKGMFERYRGRIFGALADEHAELLADEEKGGNEYSRYFAVRDKLNKFDADLMSSRADAAAYHSIILVCTVETQRRNGDGWEKANLPDFWYEPLQAIEHLSEEIVDSLLMTNWQINPPRMFGFNPIGDGEKKALRLTVKPSSS